MLLVFGFHPALTFRLARVGPAEGGINLALASNPEPRCLDGHIELLGSPSSKATTSCSSQCGGRRGPRAFSPLSGLGKQSYKQAIRMHVHYYFYN
jgi:hypothetical protein